MHPSIKAPHLGPRIPSLKYQSSSSLHLVPRKTTREKKHNNKLTWGINTLSPTETPQLTLFPSLSSPPGPTASTRASFSSLTLDSGRKMPEAVRVSALMRCTSTRSRRGARDLMDLSAVACFWFVSRCEKKSCFLSLRCCCLIELCLSSSIAGRESCEGEMQGKDVLLTIVEKVQASRRRVDWCSERAVERLQVLSSVPDVLPK
jgi:hypothetical protein